MKLLVTGGAGFIGANFILYWLKKYPDDWIVNFDNLTYAGNLENLSEVEKNPHYRFIKADITDKSAVEQAFTDIDTVVHFAAETHVDRSISDPAAFVKTNVLGTQILLDAALNKHIKRFHHVSTDEVFGALELNSTQKFNETTPYYPRSPYAASKAGSDHLVRAYFYTYGLPITMSNCSNNYGPFQHPEKLIPLAITNLLENKKVPVYGDGLYQRDWLYVIDHCRAIEVILAKGTPGETYCIGGLTQEISNLEIIKKIIKLMNKSETEIAFVKDRPGHDRKYAIDWNKIKNQLGWEPQHDFDTYIAQTISWYQENSAWWQHVKSGQYQTYYHNQYGQ